MSTIRKTKSTFKTTRILRIHEDSATVHVVCEDIETKERCRMHGNVFSLAIVGDTFRVFNISYAGQFKTQITDTSWGVKNGHAYLEETLENPYEYYRTIMER